MVVQWEIYPSNGQTPTRTSLFPNGEFGVEEHQSIGAQHAPHCIEKMKGDMMELLETTKSFTENVGMYFRMPIVAVNGYER